MFISKNFKTGTGIVIPIFKSENKSLNLEIYKQDKPTQNYRPISDIASSQYVKHS